MLFLRETGRDAEHGARCSDHDHRGYPRRCGPGTQSARVEKRGRGPDLEPGSKRPPGGTALVGDAGKHEVIMYSGKAWITPDTPTLVDIPKGAQVFPDVDKVDISNFDIPDWDFPTFSPTYFASSSGDTIVFNDYSRLEKRVDRTNFLLMKSLKMQRQDASNREFELYKLSKLK